MSLPSEAVALEEEREIGHVSCLPEERTALRDGDNLRAVHGALVGRDVGVRVGVIGFYAEPVEVFHHVELDAKVRSVAEIHGFVIHILPFVQQAVFDGILQFFIEQTDHKLLRRLGEKLVAEVDVVCDGVLELRISLFLIIFVDNRIRDDFEEARTVDRASVGEAEVHVLAQSVFRVEAGEDIDVLLVSLRVFVVCREFQNVSLVRMLHTDAGNQLPGAVGIFHHRVSGTDAFGGVVIQRVADISIRAGREQEFVEVLPVFAEVLRVGGAGCRVEGIFVEEAVALLIAVHAAEGEVENRLAVREGELVHQVEVSRLVFVGVMLPATGCATRGLEVRALHEYLGVVRRLAVRLRDDGRPVEAEFVVVEEAVLALEGRIDDVLVVPLHADGTFFVVLAVADFCLLHIHVSVVPRQFVVLVDMVVKFGVDAEAGLRRGVIAVLDAVVGLAGLVEELAFLAPVCMDVTAGQHDAEAVRKETIAVGDAGGEVRERALPFHPQVVHFEVVGSNAGILGEAHRLVGRLLDNRAVVERLEITAKIHRVVACREVGGDLAFRGRIFHDEIDRAADAVAFHVRGKGFRNLQAVEHLGGEDIERDETVFVVRAGDFHTVNQGIIVSLVHSTEDGVLSFAATVPFNRYAGHSLDDIGNGDVRGEFDSLCTHDIHDVHGFLLDATGSGFGAAGIVGDDGNALEFDSLRLQVEKDFLGGGRVHDVFGRMITEVAAD